MPKLVDFDRCRRINPFHGLRPRHTVLRIKTSLANPQSFATQNPAFSPKTGTPLSLRDISLIRGILYTREPDKRENLTHYTKCPDVRPSGLGGVKLPPCCGLMWISKITLSQSANPLILSRILSSHPRTEKAEQLRFRRSSPTTSTSFPRNQPLLSPISKAV